MTPYSKPLDPRKVYLAWKEIPGSDKGISVREALRIARQSPESCPRLVALLSQTAKAHRSRALENALVRAIADLDLLESPPRISIIESRPIKARKTRKNVKRRYRTRAPDEYLETPVKVYIIR